MLSIIQYSNSFCNCSVIFAFILYFSSLKLILEMLRKHLLLFTYFILLQTNGEIHADDKGTISIDDEVNEVSNLCYSRIHFDT